MIAYISLDEAIQKMNDLYKADCDTYGASIPECFDNDRAINALKELTTVPRVGKWIKNIERFGDNAYHCSQCGAVLEKDDLEWRNNYYCYHCGAKMEDNKDE